MAGVSCTRATARAAVSLFLLGLALVVLGDADALASSFVHDGRTTYCWRIPASYMVKQPKWTDDVLSGADKGCPISMELNFATTDVAARTFVAVNWTVRLEKARFLNSSNALRQGAITRVVDESTGSFADVVHSNVHSCEFGSNCDPFRLGSKFVDNTPNKVANFSADGTIVFTSQQELLYPSAGIFSVLAHIIIAGPNTSSERFDFAVFQRLIVNESSATTATAAGSSTVGTKTTLAPSGGAAATPDTGARDTTSNNNSSASGALSSGTIAVIVGGVVVALALVLATVVVVLRSRRSKQGTVPERSPPRPLLAPLEKSSRHDGYSELSSIPPLGLTRHGATLPVRAVPVRSNYLSSAGPAAVRRADEMHIRDFDTTFEQTTSYQFEPDSAAGDGAARRPHPIVDSTFSVDFVYPDSTTATELLVAQRRMRGPSDDLNSVNSYSIDADALGTNDSYGQFITDNLSTTSSRVFSSASERSASVDGERFSDATDAQDVEL